MTSFNRFRLAVGAALVVGGWGTTQYARAQQESVKTDDGTRTLVWLGKNRENSRLTDWYPVGSHSIFAGGVIAMMLGSAIAVHALSRPVAKPAELS